MTASRQQEIISGVFVGTLLGMVLLIGCVVVGWAVEQQADSAYVEAVLAAQDKARERLKMAKVAVLTADAIAKRADEVLADVRMARAAGMKPVATTKATSEEVSIESPCSSSKTMTVQAEWRSVELVGTDANRFLKASLEVVLKEFDDHAKLTWERRIDLPIDPLRVEMARSLDDAPAPAPELAVPLAKPVARKLHWGSGLVCGATGGAGVIAWPEVDAGVFVGVGCTWGKGLVK